MHLLCGLSANYLHMTFISCADCYNYFMNIKLISGVEPRMTLKTRLLEMLEIILSNCATEQLDCVKQVDSYCSYYFWG